MSQLNKQQEITAYGYVHQNFKSIGTRTQRLPAYGYVTFKEIN